MAWKNFILGVISSITATILVGLTQKGFLYIRNKPLEAIDRCFDFMIGHSAMTVLMFIMAFSGVFLYPGARVFAPSDKMISQNALTELGLTEADLDWLISQAGKRQRVGRGFIHAVTPAIQRKNSS